MEAHPTHAMRQITPLFLSSCFRKRLSSKTRTGHTKSDIAPTSLGKHGVISVRFQENSQDPTTTDGVASDTRDKADDVAVFELLY